MIYVSGHEVRGSRASTIWVRAERCCSSKSGQGRDFRPGSSARRDARFRMDPSPLVPRPSSRHLHRTACKSVKREVRMHACVPPCDGRIVDRASFSPWPSEIGLTPPATRRVLGGSAATLRSRSVGSSAARARRVGQCAPGAGGACESLGSHGGRGRAFQAAWLIPI